MTTGLAIMTLIANALMGWLAFSNSPKALGIKITFGIALLISVLASSIIIYQGNPIERLHFVITKIEPDTVPWPIVGRELGMNIHYKTFGTGIANDTVFEGYSVLRPDFSLFQQQEAVAEFEKRFARRPLKKRI